MGNPAVTILHALPGRFRLSLLWPPKNIEKFEKGVMGHAGIYSVRYTPITRSILIYYNPSEVDASEILIRVALSVSLDYDLIPVEISTKPVEKGLGVFDHYAGMSLLVAWVARFMKMSKNAQNILTWNAALSTIGAIVNHAWIELKNRGVYDPEVVSVTYLLSSMFKENLLPVATGTWITTFGRHMGEPDGESMVLKAFKVYGKEQENTYYDVGIIPKKNILYRRNDLIKSIVGIMMKTIGKEKNVRQERWMKQIRNVSRSHGDILEGLGKADNRIYLRVKY